ncbi:NAD(P)/FAD-dependent oxidoreductase [Alcanivorax sp. S6407]|uniref:NAD(P)/FAD-dependent oxidoreductase n=1 Tax=Alcanivorax sp. S6407 TaxID=2926424 RepID=UPI001FF26CE5|nr:NAD(P)/FAD-dependent oxidoreductase [Alcanivorax sp. S6407]MCK0155374.1 NAD(P)/FAD-dependent oxidoreductase [Alcanivorax sp. S6407]
MRPISGIHMETVDTAIIGAGAIGLALARTLSADRSVVVLEQENRVGQHLSSRNSEVIHAGLYYPPGSLKSRLCLAGSKALYRYCEATGVPYRQCGKLLVAQKGQEAQLQQLHDNAEAVGAPALKRLSRTQWQQQEPWLNASEVLLSPGSGIFDSHSLLSQLQQDAHLNGALITLCHQVTRIECEPNDYRLLVADSNKQHFTLRCRQLILAAGLYNTSLLESAAGFPTDQVPEQRQARGNYFALSGRSPTRRLVYPMPEAHGLGVHLTVDMANQARFGPDVEWITPTLPPDYLINAERKSTFVDAVQQYWPDLNPDRLQPSYAGIRPKLYLQNKPLTDFLIQDVGSHGLSGMINLLGIESPGLTAALAIAEEVKGRLG